MKICLIYKIKLIIYNIKIENNNEYRKNNYK